MKEQKYLSKYSPKCGYKRLLFIYLFSNYLFTKDTVTAEQEVEVISTTNQQQQEQEHYKKSTRPSDYTVFFCLT